MFKRILCLIMCTIMICGCFYGCGEIKGIDGTVIFPIDHDPEYLDPQIISFVGSKNIIANCFEGLVGIDEKGEIVPAAAEKWETSIDGLEYTFYLRKDAKWKVSSASGALIGENYKETFDFGVTADDFVFAFQRALKPETKSPGATLLYPIKNAAKVNSGKLDESNLGVEALSRNVLKITLENADPDFLYTLLEPVCMPCNEVFFNATRGRYGLSVKYLIYNGPFYINNWADDASVTLRRNPDYYDTAKVMPRSLYFSINNEQDTRLRKLRDETYNAAPLTFEQANELSEKKKYTVTGFDNSILSFVFNCATPEFANVNIRRAVAASLDMEIMTAHLGAPTAKGVISSSQKIGGIFYREGTSEILRYENGNSAALLQKGLEAMDTDDVEITVICDTKHENLVRNLMQSWQSVLGINFNIFVEAMSASELIARVDKGDYELALCDIKFTETTAFSVLDCFTSESDKNFVNYKNKKFDRLIKEIKLSDGIAGASYAIKRAEEYLIGEVVVIPLYENRSYYGFGKEVTGAVFSPAGEVIYMKNILIP